MRKALASGLRSLAGSAAAGAAADGEGGEADAPAALAPPVAVAPAGDAPAHAAPDVGDDEPVMVDGAGGAPSPPPAQASPEPCEQQAGKDDAKSGKANDCCALCIESFTPWGSSLKLSSLVRKAGPRRNKHSCRVCARPVCETEGSELAGCCRKTRVPKRFWHRTLMSLRPKEDSKVRRLDCEMCLRADTPSGGASAGAGDSPSATPVECDQTAKAATGSPAAEEACTCTDGWLCYDCESQINEHAQSTVFDELQRAAEDGDLGALHTLTQHRFIAWLLTLDCEEADDARHFSGLSQRLLRVPAYLKNGVEPAWPRPAAKPRAYKSQVAQSALEAFNFVAGGKIKLAVQSVRLAARGYAFSEYILSEEFVIAWRLLLDQLGEFVDAPAPDTAPADAAPPPVDAADPEAESEAQPAARLTHKASYRAQATQVAVVTKQRASVAFDLCKRFYYYSLHLTLERLKCARAVQEPEARAGGDGGRGEADEVAKLLDETCQYLHMTALLYDCSNVAELRPSMDDEAEAQWFFQKSMATDGFVVLDYIPEAGQDERPRSGTYGAKHPAFAVLLNRQLKICIVVVRGSQGKKDHLIDIDFQYDKLLAAAPAPSASASPAGSPPTAVAEQGGNGGGVGASEWQGNVHRGMLKCARFILQTRGVRSMMALLPPDFKIRLVGHSLGAGTVALMTALLKADADFDRFDIRAHAFGTPACVSPELSVKLQPFVTSVIHREDMVPRLSFSNLVRLRSHFNRPEEKEWCSKQIDIDYDNFWSYVGWSADEKKQREMREAEEQAAQELAAAEAARKPPSPAVSAAAAAAAAADVSFAAAMEGHSGDSAGTVTGVFGDLVVPGKVVHLREDPSTGCYKASITDYADPELQWIKVQLRSIDDHYIKSYLYVIRGLKIRARIPESACQVTRRVQEAVDAEGNWRVCHVCERDVCDMLIFKSDAHRAKAIKHCMQCGKICCMDCAPANDKLPDLSRELWATRRSPDRRIVLPELGTLEPQRLCLICHAHRDNRLS